MNRLRKYHSMRYYQNIVGYNDPERHEKNENMRDLKKTIISQNILSFIL